MDTKPTHTEANKEVKKQPNTALKIVVLLALIILLVIGILLPIKLVPNAVTSLKTGFTSFFSSNFGSDEKITLSTNKSNIISGDAFTLSWDGTHQTDGSYVLSYSCTPGVTMVTSVNMPNETIPCDTSYYFSPEDNTLDLALVSTTQRIADVTLTLGFLANDASETETLSSIEVVVNNSKAGTTVVPSATTTPETPITTIPETPVTPAPTSPTTPAITRANRISNPNGTADLSVSIIAVGYLNANGMFVASDSVTESQRAAVKFAVTNIGDKNTGTWSFKATLPTSANPVYIASNQPNLGPDDGIVYTLGFDGIKDIRNNPIIISVDHENRISEVREVNNTTSVELINSSASQTGNHSGKADLMIKTMKVGVLNKKTNTFTETSNISYGEGAVQFEVINSGSTASGEWKFTADLPTSGENTFFTSQSQKSIPAGGKVILTLGFEFKEDYGNQIIVDVDSSNKVDEANESNNKKSITIKNH